MKRAMLTLVVHYDSSSSIRLGNTPIVKLVCTLTVSIKITVEHDLRISILIPTDLLIELGHVHCGSCYIVGTCHRRCLVGLS